MLLLQGLQRADLYCELFRSCLMGMIDACGGPDELKWAAFTFIKVSFLPAFTSIYDQLSFLGKNSSPVPVHSVFSFFHSISIPIYSTAFYG